MLFYLTLSLRCCKLQRPWSIRQQKQTPVLPPLICDLVKPTICSLWSHKEHQLTPALPLPGELDMLLPGLRKCGGKQEGGKEGRTHSFPFLVGGRGMSASIKLPAEFNDFGCVVTMCTDFNFPSERERAVQVTRAAACSACAPTVCSTRL